jgi:foldase protein PrsA
MLQTNRAITGMVATLVVGLGGCGGAARDPEVARVGSSTITRQLLAGWMAAIAPEHFVPDPPQYSVCIKREVALALSEASSVAVKRECEAQYRGLERQGLESLITAQWLLGEAAARKLTVSGQEVQARRQDAAAAPAPGTGDDGALQARAELSAIKLRAFATAGASSISRAQVAEYYRQHIKSLEHPEVRYLDVAENLSAAGAVKVWHEIRAGAYNLHKESLHELIEGTDITGGRYTTQAARRAIFAAKPHELSRPIKLNNYYAVFEVTRIVPASRPAFARVERTLRAQLEHERSERALTQFVSAWRRRWIARTDCAPGYIVQKCRQYTGAKAPENPVAFE